MKCVSNFARYLDLKYETATFIEYYEILKKRLKIKWAVEPEKVRRIPTPEQLMDIIGIAARVYVNYAMRLYLLAISRLRPSEARHLEVRDLITPIHKNENGLRGFTIAL